MSGAADDRDALCRRTLAPRILGQRILGQTTVGERPLGDDRGFIVIVVLWMLAALATLALVYLTYVTNTAVTVAVNTDRLQADALVNAGVELAAYRLTAESEATRPTSGTFNARVGAGRVAVTFRSEAARIDLNMAPKAVLAGLMTGLGVSASDAPDYADRILAWRSSTETGQDNPEDSTTVRSARPICRATRRFRIATSCGWCAASRRR